MINIIELSRLTGLPDKFIRRCMTELSDFIEPHIARGDKNSILYNDNAIVIFNHIKTHKDKGMSLPSIRENLAKTMKTQGDDLKNESKQDKTETDIISASSSSDDKKTVSQLLSILKEKDRDAENLRKEKEALQLQYQELEKQKLAMESSLLLLTEGKSQEIIIAEKHKKQEDRIRIAEIMKELEYLDGKMFKGPYRKQLLKELRDLQLRTV